MEVITYLSPRFGSKVRGSGDSEYKYTMLHCAALMGHCDVACYLIEVLNLNPQDRDKVCVYICVSVHECVFQCIIFLRCCPRPLYVVRVAMEPVTAQYL